MYHAVLTTHGLIRWLVLAAGLIAVVSGLWGLAARRPWTAGARRLAVVYTGLLDVQLLLGLLLYGGLSPMMRHAFGQLSHAMHQAHVRFFVAEHLVVMIVAIVLAHVGSVRLKRATAESGFRSLVLWNGLSLAVVLAGIPWWRPLIRLVAP